ncbi:hypothetical protein LXA43DRAFT_976943 [Ganoderma leucocontextum]|nr:hypothetical protein LXA43DRAFT_976943 [Ganoderma leucocontextum]
MITGLCAEQSPSGQSAGFRFLWSHNIPVVVERAGSKLRGRWTPAALVESYGADEVSMIRYGLFPAQAEAITVNAFFSEFRKASSARDDVVKIKDWPPSADFSEKFREYFRDFMDAVPMPSYTRDDGYMNLTAYYPRRNPAHLGPKMYVATRDLYSQGSTPLHLDATSAVNLLVHVGAMWDIFPAAHAQTIREYLRRREHTSADPIHAQDTYLTEAMLAELALQGVRPFRIYQALGEAVFIPAGCPHQVSNRRACIKIACDFLCVEGVAASRSISAEFRAIHREDVLQLDAMLWHSWLSMFRLLEHEQHEDTKDLGLTGRQRKRKTSRGTSNAKADNVRRKRQRKSERHPGLYDEAFRYSCPHSGCAGSKRPPFDFNGLMSHL